MKKLGVIALAAALAISGAATTASPVMAAETAIEADDLHISSKFSIQDEIKLYKTLADNVGIKSDDGNTYSMKDASGMLATTTMYETGKYISLNSQMYPCGKGYQFVVVATDKNHIETMVIFDTDATGKEFTPIYMSTSDDSQGAHPIDLTDLFADMTGIVKISAENIGVGRVKKQQEVYNKDGNLQLSIVTEINTIGENLINVKGNAKDAKGNQVSDVYISAMSFLTYDNKVSCAYTVVNDHMNDTAFLIDADKYGEDVYSEVSLAKLDSKTADGFVFKASEEIGNGYTGNLTTNFKTNGSVDTIITYVNGGDETNRYEENLNVDMTGIGKFTYSAKSTVDQGKTLNYIEKISCKNAEDGGYKYTEKDYRGANKELYYSQSKVKSVDKKTKKLVTKDTIKTIDVMQVGDSFKCDVNNTDINSKVSGVTFKSSNKKVMTVTKKGTVKALKTGNANVTGTWKFKDGSVRKVIYTINVQK